MFYLSINYQQGEKGKRSPFDGRKGQRGDPGKYVLLKYIFREYLFKLDILFLPGRFGLPGLKGGRGPPGERGDSITQAEAYRFKASYYFMVQKWGHSTSPGRDLSR